MGFARPTKDLDLQEKAKNEKEHKEITQQKCQHIKCKSESQLQYATKQYISPLFNKIAFTEKHFTKDQLTILPVELK